MTSCFEHELATVRHEEDGSVDLRHSPNAKVEVFLQYRGKC
jgi:hypothetical protein